MLIALACLILGIVIGKLLPSRRSDSHTTATLRSMVAEWHAKRPGKMTVEDARMFDYNYRHSARHVQADKCRAFVFHDHKTRTAFTKALEDGWRL